MRYILHWKILAYFRHCINIHLMAEKKFDGWDVAILTSLMKSCVSLLTSMYELGLDIAWYILCRSHG